MNSIEKHLSNLYKHVVDVKDNLDDVIYSLSSFDITMMIVEELRNRGIAHDFSKLKHPEVETFSAYLDLLSSTEYGSQEQLDIIRKMKPAIESHYSKNRHHPEHFSNGVQDMNLMDLTEMICDWIAASERSDEDLLDNIESLFSRFNIDEQLGSVLRNTVVALRAIRVENEQRNA